jgi:hypothetical protein
MDYQNEIRTANSDPQKLEQLYLAAKNEDRYNKLSLRTNRVTGTMVARA